MNKMTRKIILSFVCMVVVASAVLAGYYFLNNRDFSEISEENAQPASEVEKLEAKDLELKYPGTPSEVVKLYWRLNKCMYNTQMKQKDLDSLMKQLRTLYDEELLDVSGNSWDEMLEKFEQEKKSFAGEKRVISVYSVDEENDVIYGKIKGRDCATLTSEVMETVKTKNTKTYAKFMCRKDSEEKWKILGWEKIDKSETLPD